MNKKYSFNEQFFQTLTPQSLYFLGVLATDGCISNIDGEKYEIRIESADKDLVESLKRIIQADNQLHHYQRIKDGTLVSTWVLSLRSKQAVHDIIQFGVTPRKTFAMQFPCHVDNAFLAHYIRGVFDGDGSVFFLKPKEVLLLNSKISSACKPYLESIAQKLNELIGISKRVYVEKDKYYSVHYGIGDSVKLYDYMYKEAENYLSRKRCVFEEFFQIRGKNIDVIKCQYCGKSFERRHKRQKICDGCKPDVVRRQSVESKRRRRIWEKREERLRGPVYKNCPVCGVEFEYEHTRRIYCSDRCYNKYWNKQRIIKKKEANPMGRTASCTICGKVFYINAEGKRKYCSDECVKEGQRRADRRFKQKRKDTRSIQ